MKVRIAWVKCPDCGRHGVNGGCHIAQRKVLWWWEDLIVQFDRGGCVQPVHFPTKEAAKGAAISYFEAQKPSFIVVSEFQI